MCGTHGVGHPQRSHGGEACGGGKHNEVADFLKALANVLDGCSDKKDSCSDKPSDCDHGHRKHHDHHCHERHEHQAHCGDHGYDGYRHSHHDHHCHDHKDHHDHHCHEDSEKSYSGKMRVSGDPHVKINMDVDGKKVHEDWMTQNGNGDEVNLLDTDDIDITGKFDSLHRKDGNTFVVDETITVGDEEIEINAANDTVKIDGELISKCDLKDGYCTADGTKVTKDGNKITIETKDGQKVTVQDKGKYLNTDIEFDDYESSEMSGMLGDSVSGKTNKNADDYIVDDKASNDKTSDCDCNTQHGSDWASKIGDLLRSLAPLVGDPMISSLLTSTANLLGSGNVDNIGDIANKLLSAA